VTVTGVDNELVDGTRQVGVTVGVDAAASDDAFDGAPAQTVQVTVTDDDAAGFALADTVGLVVTESGDTDAFTVVLTGQPSADVVFDVTSADVGEAAVSPATLTFSPVTWSTPQPVTLTGVDDAAADGDQQTEITVVVDGSLSDPAFVGLGAGTHVVTTDDDVAGVTSSTDTLTVEEDDDPAFFTIRLDAAPTGNVVITVSSADPGDVTVSPAVLTFTGIDWDAPQGVEVTAVEDDVADGDRQTQVTIAVDPAQSDPTYASVPARVVTVTTLDEDAAASSTVRADPPPTPMGR
jgi:hypothetical protein